MSQPSFPTSNCLNGGVHPTYASLAGTVVAAQAPQPGDAVAFDVTSVKLNKSGSQSSGMHTGNGNLIANNISVRELIWTAYRLQDFQLVSVPGWVESDRFDVAARSEGRSTPDQFREKLQRLLADRFKLTAHRETRQSGVYNLVLAKRDRKIGDGIRRSVCEPGKCDGTNTNNLVLRGDGITLDRFAEWLSQRVSRVVHNKTNLDGAYDIDLAWSNDPAVDPSHPSLLTALQEQLGLKLESTKGPVDVLVIDHVEQPAPD
jgi:uncharacterized protein (TIGR03435 family)